MAKLPPITPAAKPIRAYYAALRDFADQNVSQEQAVRAAFQTLLADLARPLKWTAIPELGKKVRQQGKKTRVIPDGTLRDKYQLPRGYWEAKDSADDLDAEIRDKRAKGYPLDNTIFWTPARAVLFQSGAQVMDVTIAEANGQPGAFCDLLHTFFTYIDKPLVDFDDAVDEFTSRVPEVGKKLAEIIAASHKSSKTFRDAFTAFFELCKTTLNPNISREAVDEMLVQHLLTARLFNSIFNNPEFLRKNVIASEVEKVIDALTSKSFSRDEFLKSLDRFYVAIENAAARVPDWSSKQHFLNNVYERFFQGYCVKTADTHGIVYTPQPIVDFMCASVEWALEKEFGKKLGDDAVNILDPCTGTGNFVVNLMRRAAERGNKYLARMYREQLFANEIMLMPYYIAALNIEHEFFEHTGEYVPFEGLCFVDTLELVEPKHTGLFSAANLKRVERQKRTPITVVIGNPPYNAKQLNANDRNRNRAYPVIDARIKNSYAKDSVATSKIALKDMYVRFWRWAMDALGEGGGVVCFVTNNSFVEQHALDGMRAHLVRHFSAIYHLDLHGNVRHDPTKSGNAYNVFGIQVGVGITIAIRHGEERGDVQYAAISPDLRREAKLQELSRLGSAPQVQWKPVVPSKKNEWIRLKSAGKYEKLVSLGSKQAKAGKAVAIFKMYTRGVATARDSTVYSPDRAVLDTRIRKVIDDYNAELDRVRRNLPIVNLGDFVDYSKIKWSDGLLSRLRAGEEMKFDPNAQRLSQYRPFCRSWLYFSRQLNEAIYSLHRAIPPAGVEARMLCVTGVGSERPFANWVVTDVPDLNFFGPGTVPQWFPLDIVNEDGTQSDNITDWSLNLFRAHFATVSPAAATKTKKLTKWDIFHYVYAILHHQGYRDTFAENLKRELPRIPLAKSFDDFTAFATAGEKLAKLHLHYDDEKTVKPYKLREEWHLTDEQGRKRPKSWHIDDKMRLSKDKATLIVNPTLTLHDIPTEVFRYRLGNRSALEWVIDQYQVYTDPKSGITSDANAWGEERNDPEYIVRLVKQVVTVSLETMKIVDALPKDFGGPPVTPAATDDTEPPPAAPESKKPRVKPLVLRGESPTKQQRLKD